MNYETSHAMQNFFHLRPRMHMHLHHTNRSAPPEVSTPNGLPSPSLSTTLPLCLLHTPSSPLPSPSRVSRHTSPVRVRHKAPVVAFHAMSTFMSTFIVFGPVLFSLFQLSAESLVFRSTENISRLQRPACLHIAHIRDSYLPYLYHILRPQS